ncbi:MAG TPA: alanine racemase [Thermoanaerobaculia bacterium]|nr:alanine racemase [Thermoanaerobaculia bacterium]HUM30593.1 alanine racemase [Thermoanaerobaculia bacterium]HXK68879.1 alanine racemase [Thermoanaerobaculia bacterium]
MIHTTWCEISTDNLLHNVRIFRELTGPDIKIMAVIKANAYGHGMGLAAKTLAPAVEMFGVHSAVEALDLCALCLDRPILIMGYILKEQVAWFRDRDVHILASTPEVLDAVAEVAPNLPIHLKIETGTNRQGFTLAELPGVMERARSLGLTIEGAATHFANIEDTTDHSFARTQMSRFEGALETIRENGANPTLIHTACSAAALLFPDTYYSMIRIGISLYGHWPSKETIVSWRMTTGGQNGLSLHPCLTWKTVVGQIKILRRGESVGYGCTWKATRESKIAVLPIGYSDGYDRKLSSRASVLIGGHRAPVVGRVCMNIVMVDVTDLENVKVGDEVVLLGRQGDEVIRAEELGEMIGTINYEVLSRISPLIPRIAV